MTTTTVAVGDNGTFLGGRYTQLPGACETLASDPAMTETDSMFVADGLRPFANSVCDARLLEGLSEPR